ncbi:hypothetical protein SLS57_004768 [Botryosphaeria dothidea]
MLIEQWKSISLYSRISDENKAFTTGPQILNTDVLRNFRKTVSRESHDEPSEPSSQISENPERSVRGEEKPRQKTPLLSPKSPTRLVISDGGENANAGQGRYLYELPRNIYVSSVAKTEHSHVFSVDAKKSWAPVEGETPTAGGSYEQKSLLHLRFLSLGTQGYAAHSASSRGNCNTIKCLSADMTSDQFHQENDSLLRAAEIKHPNIVEIISAFRFESPENGAGPELLNFAFPLAMGTLEGIFGDDENLRSKITKSFDTLWTQFEGLASAVAHLHISVQMAHRNIRPSNILIYQNRSDDNLTLKLADFGLSVVLDKAISLGIKTSSTGPTRTPSDVFASDIFSLGCVFVELESFLAHGGIGGLKKFRDFVRTEYYEGESDDIRDLHSNDKEQAKPEVTAWLFDLSAKNDKCSKLNRITGMMLRDRQARPTAGEVCRKFVEANINQPRKWFDGMRSKKDAEDA